MILITLAAAAALTQWSREGQEVYTGPGWFCGGGYRVHLSAHDRVVAQPQAGGAAGAQLRLSGRQVSVWTGVQGGAGPVVSRGGGGGRHQAPDGPDMVYSVTDETPYGVRVTSDGFRGFKRDAWFFSRANFDADAEEAVRCLAAETEH